MRFGVLGPLQIEHDGELLPLSSGRQRAVLAALLIAGGRAVSADRLIEAVWGSDLPANPTNTLQHGVAQIRKVLEPGRGQGQPPQVLVSTDGGYRLDLDGHQLDAKQLDQGVSEARRLLEAGQASHALERGQQAINLWRGPAYGEFVDQDFARAEAERLTELWVDGRQVVVDARLAALGPETVVAELEALVGEYPYREGLWARLMTALYQAGRQADALRTYRRAATALGEELGLDPSPDLQALEQQILLQDPGLAPAPSMAPVKAVSHNLPAPTTPLIGRKRDLAAVLVALAQHRLITLLGPGGSGKTRLAVEAGHRVVAGAGSPPFERVTLVRLDDLNDGSLLAPAVGAVLAMPESPDLPVRETLAAFISSGRLLLVLDNCEHLVAEVAELVHHLLSACPNLAVLATSQAPIQVSGEHRLPVPPLALPGADGSPFVDLDQSPAVELFLARAAAVDPGRTLSPDELNAVANIVQALDGIPLAIELAAARTDLFSPTEIARDLADRLDVLAVGPRDAPRRQRTLRDAVEWSHHLLTSDEQECFARLAIFAGGFEMAAAAHLTGAAKADMVATIGRLVEVSLLTRDVGPEGTTRFRMLETLRHYGLDRLDHSAETDLRRRHAEYFADRANELDLALMGGGQTAAFASFIADEDNLRAAMCWSLDHAVLGPGVRIAARSGRFWDWRGALAEANTWLTRFVSVVEDDTLDEWAFLLSWHAYFSAELGNTDEAGVHSARGRRVALEQNDRRGLVGVLSGEAMQARVDGDADEAIRLDAVIRSIGEELDDRWMCAWADNHDALAHLALGRREEAATAAKSSHRTFSAIGDSRATGWALTVLALVAHELDHNSSALRRAEEAVALSLAANDGRNAAWAYQIAAAAARAGGDDERATALDHDAEALLEARGMPFSPWHRLDS